jgi:stage II sporulation protein E
MYNVAMPYKINTKNALMYLTFAFALIFLNFATDDVPLSSALYFAMLMCGTSPLICSAIYILSSVVYLNLISLATFAFSAILLSSVTLIYRRMGKSIRFEYIIYLAISEVPYLIFSPIYDDTLLTLIENEYAVKGINIAISLVFSLFAVKFVHTLLFRLYRCKLKEDEIVCISVVATGVLLGVYNVAGNVFYPAICAGGIVFFVRLTRSPTAIIIAAIFALPATIATLSLEHITYAILLCIATLLFVRSGRVAPSIIALALVAAYYWVNGYFLASSSMIIIRCIVLLLFTIAPCICPDETLKNLYLKLSFLETLPDLALDRSRKRTSEKLYRISEVFKEIECAFNNIEDNLNENETKKKMLEELKEKCCKNCEKRTKCAHTNVYVGIKKLVESGCIKGKVNLIDLPAEVTTNCASPTDIMTRLNSLLYEYRRYMTEAENAKSGRKLLAEQARGVSDVMKNCAVELCKSLTEYKSEEEILKRELANCGIPCPELYISGENSEVLAMIERDADIKKILEILNNVTQKNYVLKDKFEYGGNRDYLVFTIAPALDATFGVALKIKKGERVSGDTHSVIKISESKFLMALSDGMGSGEYAQKVSATAISLIEAFYRANMPEEGVLETINKLLSFNRDERFTCIDIAAVNLESGVADFIKIGSPAGIILREGEVKVLESDSLPLGILDTLHPTICREKLKSGDMVVFMSDGITSAFPSQPDLYEFMQSAHRLNPQSLADEILLKALTLTGGEATDDMTVVCTRLFER